MDNFDTILLANSLIEVIIAQELESLEREHMQIFMVCCGGPKSKQCMENAGTVDSWLKVFQKLKDYLLVSVCDPELCEESLEILHNFLTADQLKYQVYEETRDIFVKSLELLYTGESDFCRDTFRAYLQNEVLQTEETDNALKKFYKSVLTKF